MKPLLDLRRMASLILAVSLLGVIPACSVSPQESEVKRNAKAIDSTTRIIRVNNLDRIKFVLVTQNKGYELSCENPIELLTLIQSTGYPSFLLDSFPPLKREDEMVKSLKIDEQPVLSCLLGTKVTYKATLDGRVKYFFATARGQNRLYQVGCLALAKAMNLNVAAATEIPATLINDLNVFTVSDEDDISCMTGVEIGAKVSWENGESKNIVMMKAQRLPLTTFSALKGDGSPARILLTKEGRCEWIEQTTVGNALLVSGNTPIDFQNEAKCTLTFTAETGTAEADSKIVEIKAPPLPVEANGWSRDAASDNGIGGALGMAGDGICNGTEDCVYKDLMGHLWTKMDNQYRTYDQALGYCFDLAYGTFSDWRLPTSDELKLAADDKMYSLFESSKLNLYDYSWAINANPLNPDEAEFVSLRGNGISKANKSTILRNICIR